MTRRCARSRDVSSKVCERSGSHGAFLQVRRTVNAGAAWDRLAQRAVWIEGHRVAP